MACGRHIFPILLAVAFLFLQCMHSTSAFSHNQRQRRTSTARHARPSRPFGSSDDERGDGLQREEISMPKTSIQAPDAERPTETMAAQPEPELMPSKPKIVVFGATGKVGRRVVQQLLEAPELQSAVIVAFCRDYDHACQVLYDDLVVANSQKKGPKLQIICGEIISKDDVFADESSPELDLDDIDEKEWLQRAQSAAKFYGTDVSMYNDRKDWDSNAKIDKLLSTDALEEAISGCTTIISCVGSVRPTNLWTDFVMRPFIRVFRKDVSSWCSDSRHPYYTNYLSTRKLLDCAEEEQSKRQSAFETISDQSENSQDKSGPPRIRFIRISDLCLAHKPWNFVPMLANAFHSMVFRYHDMAEKALEESSLLDTVILRPGDLVEDERPDGVALEVNVSENIASPSIVGRDDVAALAVAGALLPSHHFTRPTTKRAKPTLAERRQRQKQKSPLVAPSTTPPFHCTLGLRWVGETEAMQPYPAQGTFEDGLPTAKKGLRKTLKEDKKRSKEGRVVLLKGPQPQKNPHPVLATRTLKPYGLFAAVPVYLMMAMVVTSLAQSVSGLSAGQSGRWARVFPPRLASFMHFWLTRIIGSVAPWMLGWKYRTLHGGAKFISI